MLGATGRPQGARGSGGRTPAFAAAAGMKREECAPPSANVRLSNTCMHALDLWFLPCAGDCRDVHQARQCL